MEKRGVDIMKSTRIIILSAVLATLGFGKSAALELGQNCPNPFSGQTCITFELAESQKTSLSIYNLRGVKVCTLLDGVVLNADHHEATWDGRDENGRMSPVGVYLYRLESGNSIVTKRLTLVK